MTVRSWLREPLVHFLLAGAALFVLVARWEVPDDSGRTIRLGREDLLVFMQGRAQVYDDATFNALLDNMSAEDRETLIRDAALQEALYREGRALNLSEADPLVRQRLVQQMRLILSEEAAADIQLTDADVRSYFERNRAQYAAAPAATFTHVFLRDPATKVDAQALLQRLRAASVPAEESAAHGDRFLYQLNYSEADRALVSSHFGDAFAEALFALDPGQWQGPMRSQHGWHLVLPLRMSAPRAPQFAKVAARVRDDAIAERRRAAAENALDLLLNRYTIRLEGGV